MQKQCPRCGKTFNCLHNEDPMHCQCTKVKLTMAASLHIRHNFIDCLCGTCLRDINDNHHPYALYVHGFGSGAKSNSSRMVGNRVSGYEWLHPEMPLDPEEALRILNEHVAAFAPEMIIGTSMGGLLISRVTAPDAVKVVVNPALEMDRALRRIGYGKYDFFCEREDGVQQYVIDEPLVQRYAAFQKNHEILPGKQNFVLMSADDELLGHEMTKKNAALLAEYGFDITFSDRFGHRLNEQSAKKIAEVLLQKA